MKNCRILTAYSFSEKTNFNYNLNFILNRKYMEYFLTADQDAVKICKQYKSLFNHVHIFGIEDYFEENIYSYIIYPCEMVKQKLKSRINLKINMFELFNFERYH